jgi:hypothetical protein
VPKDAAIRVALDDTLATKKGPHVSGIGSHIDAVRSTRRENIFAFGHFRSIRVELRRRPSAVVGPSA